MIYVPVKRKPGNIPLCTERTYPIWQGVGIALRRIITQSELHLLTFYPVFSLMISHLDDTKVYLQIKDARGD